MYGAALAFLAVLCGRDDMCFSHSSFRAAAFHTCVVDPAGLSPALGGVGVFYPDAFIEQQRCPPRTVIDLRQPGERQVLLLIQGGTNPHLQAEGASRSGRRDCSGSLFQLPRGHG